MEDWQIKLVTAAGMAVIGFAGGYGTYWLKNRAKQRDFDRKQQEREAEYDEFKKKRKLFGSGEVERMERADKLTDIMIKQKKHQITAEEFDAMRDRLITGRKRSAKTVKVAMIEAAASQSANVDLKAVQDFIYNSLSKDMPEDSRKRTAVKSLSIIEERGPNDKPVGYDADGNKVEWLPSEEGDGSDDPFWAIELLRNEDDIAAAQEEFFEKVWWNRKYVFAELDAKKKGIPYDPTTVAASNPMVKKIEDKYGVENLGWDDFEWGMVNGKLSALRWVQGAEWDFLDT